MFATFSISSFILIYIWFIDDTFSTRRPLLFKALNIICIIIIAISLFYLVKHLVYQFKLLFNAYEVRKTTEPKAGPSKGESSSGPSNPSNEGGPGGPKGPNGRRRI